MSYKLDDFHRLIKEKYPEISARANHEYEKRWGDNEEDECYNFLWFESLANALNAQMNSGINYSINIEMLKFIGHFFTTGDDVVKNCIDVSFVENLFWEVPKQGVEMYWSVLPQNLKELYVAFHRHPPL